MIALAWLWGLIWLGVASFALWPLVNKWFAPSDADEARLIRWPLTIGLSLGALTLWMLAVGLWRINVWVALAFPLVAIISPLSAQRPLSAIKIKNSVLSVFSVVNTFLLALRRGNLKSWLVLAGLIALAVVLGQATYYPFTGDDEISRYAYYARLIFTQGNIGADVRGYPMLMALSYAYVFFVTGQLAEQLARLIPVLLSASTVIATAALGRRWFGARGGWAAAFMLIATPLYLYWSPDGYVDIPTALYFVLGAYAADVWLAGRQLRWAALAGVCAGLALWTKQAGFAMLPSLGLVFAWGMAGDWFGGKRESTARAARDGLIALAAAFIVGGLWYLRNVYYDGWGSAIPDPGAFYTQQADRSLTMLIPFVGQFRAFGIFASPLYIIGLTWGLAKIKQAAWPLIWGLPYTLLWWWLYSYDPRFLLTVLPFYAALAGGMIGWVVETRIQTISKMARWTVIGLIVLGAGASAVGSQLGGLRQWVVAPTATYAERLTRAKGDMYPTVEFIRDRLPPAARIVSIDGRYRYYLIDRSIDVFYPGKYSDLAKYDYFVLGSWWHDTYVGFGLGDSDVVSAIDDPTKLERIYFGPTNSMAVYRVVKP